MSETNKMIASLFQDIIYSIGLIQKRSMEIHSSDDFMKDEQGLEKLDSISMRLLAIGEAFKNIDKLTEGRLLVNHPEIDWRGVKGIRDVLSHHYFDLNAEIIFDICKHKLPQLLETSIKINQEVSDHD